MAALPRAYVTQMFLPVERAFFLPTIAKRLLIGGHLLLWYSLYYFRVFLQYEVTLGDMLL